MEPIFRERYDGYKVAITGKQSMDQFYKIFKGEEDNSRYSSIFLENDDYWIINITTLPKLTGGPYYPLNRPGEFFSLYLHKYKDIVILKAPILCHDVWDGSGNNARTYFCYRLRRLGFTKYEFSGKLEIDIYSGLRAHIVKILIPKDKNEDDLISIFSLVDKFNEFTKNRGSSVWSELSKIKEIVGDSI